jgi:putative PEP-CTERM system histidine kinase
MGDDDIDSDRRLASAEAHRLHMTLPILLNYAGIAAAGVLAIAALLRSPRVFADWVLSATMAVLVLERIFAGAAAAAGTAEAYVAWHFLRLCSLALLPVLWLAFSLSYARGDARKFLRQWRLALLAAVVLPLLAVTVFRRHLIVAVMRDGADPGPTLMLGAAGVAVYFFLLVGSVAALMNLERTFRAAVGTMRWRIKFMLLGLGALLIVRLYTSSQALLFRGIDPQLENVNAGALFIGGVLILRSLFRAGRFQLDVYPSQSVLQGSVTVLLAGIYLLIVGVFAKVVSHFGGDAGFAFKTFLVLVSIVVLAILLQSDRLRLRLRTFVSRHFQRPLYDYRTMWQKFNEATASRVDQTDLGRALVRLVADMFQALSVSLWLVDEKRGHLTLTASTSLPENAEPASGSDEADTRAILAHLQANPEPADIDTAPGEWAAALRRRHPGEFANGGHRICLPLIGRGEVLGLITLGDRVSGVPFSVQDFDMLKCVGDHAAASLLNVQLSQRLYQTKELEAFQTMAAFFVHDLKNAASTLSLMLQNLPEHYDDPEFRADALRGISKTVGHINRLISRLSLLRHELKIQPAPADLNELVRSVLSGLENAPTQRLVTEFQNVPPLPLDRDQFGKVVTNLVLNAIEASPADAEVRIGTQPTADGAVLTVVDHGCGMSPEFLHRSLFRPFQTTKKTGLGIGMFQSRMIVEAHRGRIAVASEQGKGTTFQVFLPAAASPPPAADQTAP